MRKRVYGTPRGLQPFTARTRIATQSIGILPCGRIPFYLSKFFALRRRDGGAYAFAPLAPEATFCKIVES